MAWLDISWGHPTVVLRWQMGWFEKSETASLTACIFGGMAGRLGSAGTINWNIYSWSPGWQSQGDRTCYTMTGFRQSKHPESTEWKLHSLSGVSLRSQAVTSSTFCWWQSPKPSPNSRRGEFISTSWWGSGKVTLLRKIWGDGEILLWRSWTNIICPGDTGETYLYHTSA